MSRRCAVLVRVDGPVSIARLHGRACRYYGAVPRTLSAVGSVQRAAKVGPPVSCGCHMKARAAR